MDPRYPKDIFEFQHLRQTLFRSHCAITALLFSVISQLHNLAVWRTRRKHDTFKHKAQSQISYPVPQTPAGNHFHGNWSACVLQPPPPPPPASLPKSFSLLLMSKQYLSSSGVGGVEDHHKHYLQAHSFTQAGKSAWKAEFAAICAYHLLQLQTLWRKNP